MLKHVILCWFLQLFWSSKLTNPLPLNHFLCLFCERSNQLLPEQREKKNAYKREEQGKQAAEFGRLQIYHPAMEWKEVLLVWRVGFHFTLIQCEVFKTWVWFGEINGKPRLFPLRLTPLWVLIYNELSPLYLPVSCRQASVVICCMLIQYLKHVLFWVWTSDKWFIFTQGENFYFFLTQLEAISFEISLKEY